MRTGIELRGKRELEARLRAIGDTSQMLRDFAPIGLAAIKVESPRRTGNLGRNNVISAVTNTEVRYKNVSAYAAAVHFGTRPHEIVPRRRRALRFAPGAGSTLAGRARSGAQVVFAKRVQHPGTKANPWIERGLVIALKGYGFAKSLINVWNRAG